MNEPIAIVMERDEALKLVALLTQAGPLAETWFKNHETFVTTSRQVGSSILKQIIEQSEITLVELQAAIKDHTVSGLVLNDG